MSLECSLTSEIVQCLALLASGSNMRCIWLEAAIFYLEATIYIHTCTYRSKHAELLMDCFKLTMVFFFFSQRLSVSEMVLRVARRRLRKLLQESESG